MKNKGKNKVVGLCAIILTILGITIGPSIWENSQSVLRLNYVIIESEEDYKSGGGDLHWSSKGKRIYLQGLDKPIDFPLNKWYKTEDDTLAVKDTLAVGDTVNVIIRKSCPYFGLFDEYDGLSIKKPNGQTLQDRYHEIPSEL